MITDNANTGEAREANREIARTILDQLGGKKFVVMTGAKDFLPGNRSLMFKLPSKGGWTKHGINIVSVTLNDSDLYDVQFKRLFKLQVKLVSEEQDVFCGDLQAVFTKHTGLKCRI